MAQIIRPMDGTTFKPGDRVKIVFFDKDNPGYPVGLPDAPDFHNNDLYGSHYEEWLSAGIYTTENKRDENPSGYPGDTPIFSTLTPEQKRVQAKERSNSLYHQYSKDYNNAYALSTGKTLTQYPLLKPDPGVDLMRSHHDEHTAALNMVDVICNLISPAMAAGMGLNIDELRALNQEKREEHERFVANSTPCYAGDPPVTKKEETKPVKTKKPDRFDGIM
jgi:hypothetical protein